MLKSREFSSSRRTVNRLIRSQSRRATLLPQLGPCKVGESRREGTLGLGFVRSLFRCRTRTVPDAGDGVALKDLSHVRRRWPSPCFVPCIGRVGFEPASQNRLEDALVRDGKQVFHVAVVSRSADLVLVRA